FPKGSFPPWYIWGEADMDEPVIDKNKRMHALVCDNIDRQGQHSWSVDATEDDPPDFIPFAYIFGNFEHSLSELLITSPIADRFGQMLNSLSKLQRDRGKALEHGEEVNLGGKCPVRMLDAGARANGIRSLRRRLLRYG